MFAIAGLPLQLARMAIERFAIVRFTVVRYTNNGRFAIARFAIVRFAMLRFSTARLFYLIARFTMVLILVLSLLRGSRLQNSLFLRFP